MRDGLAPHARARDGRRSRRVVEVRTYVLKEGVQEAFLELFRLQVRPLLARWGIDVVACRASLGDGRGAYLIRAFDSLEDRERREAAFYDSPDWRGGPRAQVLACIEAYSDAVLELEGPVVDALRAP